MRKIFAILKPGAQGQRGGQESLRGQVEKQGCVFLKEVWLPKGNEREKTDGVACL